MQTDSDFIGQSVVRDPKKKPLWPLFMDGVQLLKSTEPPSGDSLIFSKKSPRGLGTYLINFGRM